MRSSMCESLFQRLAKSRRLQRLNPSQQSDIRKVFNPSVRSRAWHRVGMQLFRDVGFDRVEPQCGRCDTGEVENVMIDKLTGKVAYAVVTFGGFLGIGAERRTLPWSVLNYDVDMGGYVVDVAPDVLKKAPLYSDDSRRDPAWNDQVHGVFGVAPYWH